MPGEQLFPRNAAEKGESLSCLVDAKMVTNCRGNPAWLPILRAAIPPWRAPYNILSGSGYAGLGISSSLPGSARVNLCPVYFELDRMRE